jgi:hypothetical protein
MKCKHDGCQCSAAEGKNSYCSTTARRGRCRVPAAGAGTQPVSRSLAVGRRAEKGTETRATPAPEPATLLLLGSGKLDRSPASFLARPVSPDSCRLNSSAGAGDEFGVSEGRCPNSA